MAVSTHLTKELAFYRKYHRNPVNVGLHIVGIPTILLSSIYNATPLRLSSNPHLSVALAFGLYYWYYYTRLDPKFGFWVGAFIAAASWWLGAESLRHGAFGYKVSWGLWSAGWIAQFIGHGAFEGRAPALFDNLHQALVLAPYFAFLEIAAGLGMSHAVEAIESIDARGFQDKKKPPTTTPATSTVN